MEVERDKEEPSDARQLANSRLNKGGRTAGVAAAPRTPPAPPERQLPRPLPGRQLCPLCFVQPLPHTRQLPSLPCPRLQLASQPAAGEMAAPVAVG